MDNRKRKYFTLEGKYNAIVAVDSKKKTQKIFFIVIHLYLIN